MKKFLMFVWAVITVLLLISVLTDNRVQDPGVTVPDPQVNDLRINGVFELNVYPYVPWEGEYVQIICTIAPLSRFHVGAKDTLAPGFRHVRSSDGTCDGWTWLP